MTWAQRLKRVFDIPQGTLSWCCVSIHLVDIETCSECGGDVRITASIASGRLLLVRTPWSSGWYLIIWLQKEFTLNCYPCVVPHQGEDFDWSIERCWSRSGLAQPLSSWGWVWPQTWIYRVRFSLGNSARLRIAMTRQGNISWGVPQYLKFYGNMAFMLPIFRHNSPIVKMGVYGFRVHWPQHARMHRWNLDFPLSLNKSNLICWGKGSYAMSKL